jgi:putative FmdB family regulatory protein
MPIYNFLCKKCNHEYEDLVPYDESGKYETVQCPECGSGEKDKLLPRSFNFNFAQPEGTDRWNNSHDYRYKSKAPGIRAEREKAEQASRSGPNPYQNINDLDKDSNYDFKKI